MAVTPLDFGKRLRSFRLQYHDAETGKTLSQQQLGECLYEHFGIRYSGAAVSDWERNKSKININDRLLLLNIIKILKQHGGIKSPSDANLLLEAGNYRALNVSEKNEVFPEEADNTIPSIEYSGNPPLNQLFFNLPVELQKKLAEAKTGPPPAWPHMVVAVLNQIIEQWTIAHILFFLIWLWIWLITYLLITPSLQWPFTSDEKSQQAMWLYIAGSILAPLLVSLMVGIRNKDFWHKQGTAALYTFRLFIYQGASIGFHIGYFVIFAISLTQYSFQAQSAIWFEAIKILFPLAIGYTGAHLVPYNLWRAYGKLNLKDGGIFFVFIILGPLWAWFFLEFYETLITQKLGAIFILISATILVSAMTIQYRRKGTTTIPISWVILFFGLILVCQIALFFIQ